MKADISLIVPCIFSREFEIILNQTCIESNNNFKNTNDYKEKRLGIK